MSRPFIHSVLCSDANFLIWAHNCYLILSRRSDYMLNMPAIMLEIGEPSLSYILAVGSFRFSSVISWAFCIAIASTSFIVLQSPERRDRVGGGEL